MTDALVTIDLIDGSCQTLRSTLASFKNLPIPDGEGRLYWGRTKAGFSQALMYARGERPWNETHPIHHEDMVLLGLGDDADAFGLVVVHVNVGGKIFTARESTLRQTEYFRASFEFHDSTRDASSSSSSSSSIPFVDRSPSDFAHVLRFLECPAERRRLLLSPGDSAEAIRAQADFFGLDLDLDPEDSPVVDPESVKHIPLHDPLRTDRPLFALVTAALQNQFVHCNDLSTSLFSHRSTKRPPYSYTYKTIPASKRNTTRYTFESRHGQGRADIIGNMYLVIDFKRGIRGDPDVVCSAIKKVTFGIGPHTTSIDSYSGDAMRVFANGRCKIESHGSRSVVPLAFYFKDAPDLYPLGIALQHSTICVEVLVDDSSATNIVDMGLMYKYIMLDTIERRYLTRKESHEFNVYLTKEYAFTDVVIGNHNGDRVPCETTLELKDPNLILRDMIVYLKPKDTHRRQEDPEYEPLREIVLVANMEYNMIRVDHLMSRRVIPRERFGISDNRQLMYYVPCENTINASKIDKFELRLTLEPGTYDVVVVVKHHNVLRMGDGLSGLAFC